MCFKLITITNIGVPMDENEFIETQKTNLKETVDFLNNKNKKARELWVVNQFLSNLGLLYQESELISSLEEPPDVIFRESRIEVKVLLDNGREMDGEYKRKLKKSQTAKSVEDFIEPYSPQSTPFSETLKLLNSELDKINYSLSVCKDLDILFYANLSFATPPEDAIQIEEKWQNWKTVSVVGNGGWSIVLHTNYEASNFLKLNEGKVCFKTENKL